MGIFSRFRGSDDTPEFRSGPGYSAQADMVEEVAASLGKSANEVTEDEMWSYWGDKSDTSTPSYSDCDECRDKSWVHYCPECHRVDD